jgi:2'-5' RNA ligase
MRCFLAIAVPGPIAQRLTEVAGRLRAGRALPPENLHLTLAFLGEQERPAVEELHFALDRLRQQAFEIVFGPLGTFGNPPASVHAEVRPSPGLDALHRSVHGAVHAAGIALERRRFRPHVTIARLARKLAPDEVAAVTKFLGNHAASPLPGFTADALTLFRSWTRPEGSIYEPLAEYPLRTAA